MDLENIIERLKSLGYEFNIEIDEYALEFTISKVENHILNIINDDSLPVALVEIAIDMVCGEFLKLKKGMGQLSNMNFEQVAKSVKLGDTQVQFGDEASPEKRFDSVMDYLIYGHEEDFLRHRKLVW